MADNQIRLVRPDDLLVATIQLDNLVIAPDGSALVRVTPNAPAAVIVRLPPQHYLEPAVNDKLSQTRLGDSAYVAPLLAGGGARFEWTVPDGMPRVDIGPGPAGLFEAFTGLDIAPGGTLFDALVNYWFGGLELDWTFPPTPDGELSKHPLWRIRPDVPDGAVFQAGNSPMNAAVPHVLDVVFATTDGPDHEVGRILLEETGIDGRAGVTISNPFPHFRRTFLARQLTATPLGGTVSFFGPKPPADGSDDDTAFSYEHRTSLGRDVYIRSAVWGWLSTGHRAVVTTFAERVIRSANVFDRNGGAPAPTTTATLLARAELVVTEPILDLAAHAGEYPHGGREIPFIALRVDTERIDVDVPEDPNAVRTITRFDAPIQFDLTGTDHAGRAVPLRMSLAFLPDGRTASDLAGLVPDTGTPAGLTPAAVALSPEADREPGSTSITVTGVGLAVTAGGSRPVLPAIGSLQVGVDALAGMADRVPIVSASLHPTFLQQGLEKANNPLGTMLSIQPLELELPTASVGGIGNPGGVVDLITAERGAVAAAIADGAPNAEQIAAAFPLPKLLGTIDLRKLLDEQSFPKVDGVPSIPMLTRSGSPGAETLTYHFEAVLKQSKDAVPGMFLAEIARRLAGFTGGAGPRVDVDSNGVTAGFQLAIPTLAMGVMQVSNLAIAAFLRIPFTDGPLSFTFDVASRERPFQATVSLFGGGGFLSLEVTPAGLRRLEASIEFGGSVSLDIIVASGGVSVMAGIYFGLKTEIDPQTNVQTQTLEAAGFVRASGHLTVLGIVSIFVEFRLALAYKEVDVGGSKHAMFAGTASLTVGVKVLFFSKSITLTVTREFLGSAADPSFVECVDEDDWEKYCLAFAGTDAPAVTDDPFAGGALA